MQIADDGDLRDLELTLSYHNMPENSDTYKNDHVLTAKIISTRRGKISVRKDM